MRIFFLCLLFLIVLPGCRQSQETAANEADVQITMNVEPQPPQTGDATLLVTVTNPDGSPADVARVEVRGDMNHAGMEPVLGGVDLPEENVYYVPFNWSMSGDWIVDVTALLADGSSATQRFEVTVES